MYVVCKPTCATCCIFFSVAGIIFMIGMGAAFASNLHELTYGPPGDVPADPSATAQACFIAAALYAAYLLFCACQLYVARREARLHSTMDV